MNIVTIREYQKLPHKGETTLEAKEAWEILKNTTLVGKDKELLEKLENKKILFMKEDPFTKKLSLQAQSNIGIAQFTNFRVEIKPKFSDINKVVKLIEYVNGFDLVIFPESEIEFEGEKDDLSEIIIGSFLVKVQILLQQGLMKSYDTREENLSALRGKLLLDKQFQNDFRGKIQFACEYDELEYNNLENQIILYCLECCYDITINKLRKQEIRELIQIISELVEFKHIAQEDFGKINYNQMNHHYKKIHDDCKFIIDSIEISDFYDQQTGKFVNSFFVDMNEIFEKFVFMLFDEAYPHRCTAQPIEEGFRSKIYNKTIPINPDIFIKDNKRDKLQVIIDTKYKDKINDEDRYQLSMYAVIKEKNNVYAILPETKNSKIDDLKVKNVDIVVHIRYLNIDNVLNIINSKEIMNKKEAIREILTKIVPIEA